MNEKFDFAYYYDTSGRIVFVHWEMWGDHKLLLRFTELDEELQVLKFSFSKKATKFETIFHLIWHFLSKLQIKWKIVSNFVFFLEKLNFKRQI